MWVGYCVVFCTFVETIRSITCRQQKNKAKLKGTCFHVLKILQVRWSLDSFNCQYQGSPRFQTLGQATQTAPTRSDGCSTTGGPTWRPSTRRSRWSQPPIRARTGRFTAPCYARWTGETGTGGIATQPERSRNPKLNREVNQLWGDLGCSMFAGRLWKVFFDRWKGGCYPGWPW